MDKIIGPDEYNIIRSTILKNAVDYNGKARLDTIIARIIANRPDLRNNIKEMIPHIKEILDDINKWDIERQKKELKDIEPDYDLEKKSTKKEYELHPLVNAIEGGVVTRFPPEPNGYPHIGHAKAAIIDEEYAKMYHGKFILRFDDTNPLNEKIEYYDAITEGLDWLNIKPNLVKNTSDDIETLHRLGAKLIEHNSAYVCFCDQNTINESRKEGLKCKCRTNENKIIENKDKFFNEEYNQNEAIVRFRGDLNSNNTAMRDPTLFRIIESEHPLVGNKTTIWPTYDFAAPIEDSLDGVTHAFRTKEYELRNELYRRILEHLKLRIPYVIEFSRLDIDGMPVSKRKIKPLIENRIVRGWDDPRLPTLKGLKNRGFKPEAIRKFVISLGITLSETKPSIEILESFNRKIIDKKCKRLFFIQDPVKVTISKSKNKEIIVKNHPSEDIGTRKIFVDNTVYISNNDAKN
ncbi:MAG: glutamate--tRNA ligase, partial [Nitrososphaeraceae archaeon]